MRRSKTLVEKSFGNINHDRYAMEKCHEKKLQLAETQPTILAQCPVCLKVMNNTEFQAIIVTEDKIRKPGEKIEGLGICVCRTCAKRIVSDKAFEETMTKYFFKNHIGALQELPPDFLDI